MQASGFGLVPPASGARRSELPPPLTGSGYAVQSPQPPAPYQALASARVIQSPSELPPGAEAPTSPTSPAQSLSESQQRGENGGEVRGEFVYFGIDCKPCLLPVLLMSTVLGGVCTIVVQIPLLCERSWRPKEPLWLFSLALHVFTFVSMLYCAVADPGQLRAKRRRSAGTPKDLEGGLAGMALPEHAHTSWQYNLPVRRYDHYCTWLDNTLALLSHREFLLMC